MAPAPLTSTDGALAGSLFALGATLAATDTRVLGGETDDAGFPVLWSRYVAEQEPEALPGSDSIDIEAIATQRPDLIIGAGQGFPGFLADEAFEQLQRIAPTVIVSRALNTWDAELELLASVLGLEERASELVADVRRREAEVTDAITLPSQPFAVAYVSNDEPYLLFEDAALPQLLGRVGFEADDVTGKAGDPDPYAPGGDAFSVSLERLGDVADAPTLVVLALYGVDSAELRRRPIWGDLPAFATDRLVDLPASSYRPDCLGVVDTLDRLREQLA